MKIPIGTKVLLKSKLGSVEDMNNSVVYNLLKHLNQSYGYITGISKSSLNRDKARKGTKFYVISEKYPTDYPNGDFYSEEDVEPYLIYERKLKLEKLNESNL